jgi:MoaA/NifB/PqqE/SkfB family radical SAM enzyme
MRLLNRLTPRLNSVLGRGYRTLHLYWKNGSMSAWWALVARNVRRRFDRSVPIWMTFAPTFRCQCRCAHCYAVRRSVDPKRELTTEEAKSVLDQARSLGVLKVAFSGGDPLMREDIVELVRYGHDIGLLTRLSTNGIGLERERVAQLKDAGLTLGGVSIDSPDPQEHDRLRGLPGTFAKATRGIRNLREAGIPVEILTYASKANLNGGLEGIVRLGRDLDACSVYIFFPIAAGRFADSPEELLTPEERAKVRAMQDVTCVHCEIPSPRCTCCVFSRTLLYVSPYGDVTPCPFVPYTMGSLLQHSLAEVWRRNCELLDFEVRDDCFMNYPKARAAVRAHTQRVAESLGAPALSLDDAVARF